MFVALAVSLASFAMALPGAAEVPQSFSYQGNLWEAGAPVNGSRNMIFRITDASGGSVYWSTGPISVPVSRGHFAVSLAAANVPWSVIVPYIEVTIGGQVLLPREVLNAVPYSQLAAVAEGTPSGTADPVGRPGMLFYRTDTGRLRLYNGAWTDIPAGADNPWQPATGGIAYTAGRVGIGTTAPDSALHISEGDIRITAAGGSRGIYFPDGSFMTSAGGGSANVISNQFDAAVIGDADVNGSGGVVLRTGTSDRLTVTNAGRVGIGTSLPATALEVNGDVKADGFSGSGAQLTAIPDGAIVSISGSKVSGDIAGNAANITGNLATSQLDGSSVTLQGNSFNTAGKLVRLDATGRLPGADGSLLTNLNVVASSIAAGSVNDAAIVSVSGSKVTGDIPGNAANINGNLAPGQLSAGGLPANVVASSIAVGAVLDASIVTVSGSKVTGTVASALTAGGVSGSIAPSQILAGSLPSTVIASSIAVGSVHDAAIVSISGSKVSGDIAGNAANITGNLAPSQVAAGSLPATVIASSIAAGAVQDASIVSVAGSKVSGNISGNAANITGNLATSQLDGSSVTLQGNAFNSAGRLVRLDGANRLPGSDGSQLSNLSGASVVGDISGNAANITGNLAASQIAAGALPTTVVASSIGVAAVKDASIVDVSGSKVVGDISGNAANITGNLSTSQLDGSSVTLQGNSFNAAGRLVRLDGTNRLPPVDGSQLTNLSAAAVLGNINSSQINAGSLPGDVVASSIAVGAVQDASIVGVSGSKVSGNIAGNAANITGNLAPSQIAAGSLPGTVVASSVSVGSVPDAAIISLSGSKVSGNISGNAANITGNLATSQLDGSSVTLQGNSFNTAGKLVRLDATNRLPAADGSLLTNLTAASVSGNINPGQINAGTLPGDVIASSVGVGAVGDPSIMSVSGSKVSGNIAGNAANITGTLAVGQLGSGALPSGVAVPSAALDSSSVTLQGNIFNAAGRLVRLDGSNRLPIADGSQLTNLTAGSLTGNINTGQINDGALPGGVIASSVAVGAVQDASIVSVSGSKVSGNILGNAANITGNLAPAQIAAGALPATVVVSSIGVGAVRDEAIVSVSGPKVTGDISGNAANITGNLASSKLDPSSVTLQGNAFNTAGRLVRLDGSSRLPAVDGSQLLNLTAAAVSGNINTGQINAGSLPADVVASSIAVSAVQDASIVSVSGSKVSGNIAGNAANITGNLASSQLDSSSVTLQGNAFNAAGRLVRLDGANRLPIADGSQLTNLTASALSGNINASQINAGALPGTVVVSSIAAGSIHDASIVSVSGTKVTGDITGNAGNITGSLAVSQIAAGTLPSGVVASSIAVGAVGDASIVAVLGTKVSGDIAGNAANINGNLAPSQIAAGSLPATVIASSVAVGSVRDEAIVNLSGSKVQGDIAGNAANISGSLAPAQIADGLLPSGVAASSLTVASVYPAALRTGTYDAISLPAANLIGALPAANLENAVLRTGSVMTGGLTLSSAALTVDVGAAAPGVAIITSSAPSAGLVSPLVLRQRKSPAAVGDTNLITYTMNSDVAEDGFVSYIGQKAVNVPFIGRLGALVFGTQGGVNAAVTERMRITPGGSVGINTEAPTKPLHVVGDIQVGAASPWASSSQDRIVSFGDGDLVYVGEQGGDDSMVLRAANFEFRTGKVGINRTSAVYPLDVLGVIRQGGTISNTATYLGATGGVPVPILIDDRRGAGNTSILVTTNASITGGLFVVQADGKVGIGMNAPAYPLDVNGAANATSLCIGGDCKTAWAQVAPANGAVLTATQTFTGQNSFTGNVAIGKETPAAKLDVQAADGNLGLVVRRSGGNLIGELSPDSNGHGAFAVKTSNGNTAILLGSSGDSYFINSGNLGVGTASPGQKLSVAGTIESTSGGFKFPDGSVQASAVNTSGSGAAATLASTQTFTGQNTFAAQMTVSSGATFTGAIGAGAGTVGAPSYGFSGNPNTGIWNAQTNELSFSAGGVKMGRFITGGLYMDNGVIANSVGGASAPSYTFAAETSVGMYRPTAGSLGLATSGTERIRINSSGNVGIGTGSPSYRLDVNGIVRQSGTIANTAVYLGASGGIDLPLIVDDRRGAGTSMVISNDGGIGGAYFAVTADGKVGISTNTPQARLDIQGGSVAPVILRTATNGRQIRMYSTTSDNSIQWDSSAYRPAGKLFSLGLDLGGVAGLAVRNDTDSTTPLVITESGSVGIGTTSPGQKLTVAGTIESTSGGIKFPDGSVQTSAVSTSGSGAAATLASTQTFTGQNTFANQVAVSSGVTVAGFVGIGTTSPANPLVIQTAAGVSEGILIGTNPAAGGYMKVFYNPVTNDQGLTSGNGQTIRLNPNGGDVALGPSGGRLVVAGGTGNVGIGTSTPGQKLTVAGTVESTSGGFKFPDGSTQGTAATTVANAAVLHASQTFTGSNVFTQGTWITRNDPNYGELTLQNTNANSRSALLLMNDSLPNAAGLTFHGSNSAASWGSAYVNRLVLFSPASAAGIALVADNDDITIAPAGYDSGAVKHVFAASGGVGIGTGSPNARLHVAAPLGTDGHIAFFQDTTSNVGLKVMSNTSISGLAVKHIELQADSAASDLVLSPSSDSRAALVIKDGGNVGLGTASPAYRLDVLGGTARLMNTDFQTTGGGYDYIHMPYNIYMVGSGNIGGGVGNNWYYDFNGGSPVYKKPQPDQSFWMETRPYGIYFNYDTTTTTGTMTPTTALLIKNDGRVGIGTTGPAAKLQVVNPSGAGQPALRLEQNNPGSSVILAYGSDGNPKFHVQDSGSAWFDGGNVGIGTQTPGQKLSVAGTVESTSGGFKFPDGTVQTTAISGGAMASLSSSQTFTGQNTFMARTTFNAASADTTFTGGTPGILTLANPNGNTFHSGIDFRGDTSTPIARIAMYQSGGGTSLKFGTSDNYASGVSNTAMTISPNGRVGIGTDSPTSALHVVGADARLVRNTHPLVLNADAASAGTRAEIASDIGLAFATANTERIRIATDGKVGIGTTGPQVALDVNGAVRVGTSLHVVGAATGINTETDFWNDDSYVHYYPTRSSGIFKGHRFFTSATNASEAVRISSGGKVGIGTTNPLDPLHVSAGAAGEVATFRNSNGNYGLHLMVNDASDTLGYGLAGLSGIRTASNEHFAIVTGGVPEPRVTVRDNGNVGIGYIDPLVKFHVFGSASSPATSGTTPNGIIAVSNGNTYTTLYGGAYVGAPYAFWLQAAERNNLASYDAFVLNPNGGNVGVGTTNPAHKLDVAGVVNATAFYVNGSPFAGGASQWTTTGSDIYYSAGKVGIGAAPSYPLDVNAAGYSQARFGRSDTGGAQIVLRANGQGADANVKGWRTSGGSQFLGKFADNEGAWTPQFTIDSSGNVGIGTESPTQKLHIASTNNGYLRIDDTDSGVSAFLQPFGNAGGHSVYLGSISTHPVHIAPGTNPALTALNNGNVGVGTTAPNRELHVKTVDAGAAQLLLENNVGTTSELKMGPSTDSRFTLIQNGSEALSVLNSGKVGIGISNPIQKLDVFGGINANAPNGYCLGCTSSNPNGDGFFYYSGSGYFGLNADAPLVVLTSGTERMRITNSGRIGIGTATPNPTFAMTVAGTGTGSPVSGIQFKSGAGLVSLSYPAGTNTSDFELWNENAGYVRFGTSNTERLRITGAGNVGIGTASPGQKLTVAGTIESTSGGIKFPDGTVQTTANGAFAATWGSLYNHLNCDGTALGSWTGASTVEQCQARCSQVPGVTCCSLHETNPTASCFATNGSPTVGNDYDSWVPTSYSSVASQWSTSGANIYSANSGNIGIGTTSPSDKVNIAVDAGTNPGLTVHTVGTAINGGATLSLDSTSEAGKIWRIISNGSGNQGGAGGLSFYDNSAGSNRMTIETGGNVGIGTLTPGQKLTVAGTIESTSGGFKFPDGTTQTTAGGGASQWTTAGSSIYYNGGNVGIGTTSPGAPLSIKPTTDSENKIVWYDDGTWFGGIAKNSGDLGAIVVKGANANFKVKGSPTYAGGLSDLLTVQPGGNVGVGTATPATKLDVSGAATLRDYLQILAPASSNSNIYMRPASGAVYNNLNFESDGGVTNAQIVGYAPGATSMGGTLFYNATRHVFRTNAGATDALTLDGNGNIGIGSASPGAALEVVSTVSPVIRGIRSTSDTATFRNAIALQHRTSADMADGFGPLMEFQIRDNAGVDNVIGSLGAVRSGADNSGAVVLNTVTSGGPMTERMRVLSGGNVAIGTTTAGSLLSVARSLAVAGSGRTSLELYGSQTSDDSVGSIVFGNQAIAASDKRLGQLQVLRSGTDDTGRAELVLWNAGTANTVLNVRANGSLTGNGLHTSFGPAGVTSAQKFETLGTYRDAQAGLGASSIADSALLSLMSARGSHASKTAVLNGDIVGNIMFAGYAGATGGYVTGADIYTQVNGAVTNTTSGVPADMVFRTRAPGNNLAEVMRLSASGFVGVGTNSPQARLHMVTGNSFTVPAHGELGNGTSGRLLLNGSEPGLMLSGDYTSAGGQTGTEQRLLGLQIGAYGGSDTRPQIYYGGQNLEFVQATPNGTTTNRRMVLDTSGNVGIGVTAPTQKLDVNGIVNASAFYVNGSPFAGGGSQWTTTGSNIYYNSGNVGVGTTNPTASFQVTDQGMFQAAALGGNIGLVVRSQTPNQRTVLAVAPNGTGQYGDVVIYNTSDLQTNYERVRLGYDSNGYFALTADKGGTGSYRPLTFFLGGSERVRIDTAGNVGIGTTSPGTKLHVYETGASAIARIQSNTGNAVLQLLDGAGAQSTLYSTSGDLRLSSNGADDAVVIKTASGKVGIGTTVPASRLHISDTNSLVATLESSEINATVMSLKNTAPGGKDYRIYSSANAHSQGAGKFFIYDATDGAYRLAISSTGNVGMGTQAPAKKLDVVGDARLTSDTATLQFYRPTNGRTGYISHYDALGGLRLHSGINGGGETGGIAFLMEGDSPAANTPYLTVLGSGNVGIGTLSPATRLHVSGDTTLVATLESSEINATVMSLKNTAPGGKDYRIYSTANAHSQGAGKFFIYNATDGAYRLAIDASGNVGIGTTGPGSNRLQVTNSGANTIAAIDPTSGGSTGASSFLFMNTWTGSSNNNNTDASIRMSINGVPRFGFGLMGQGGGMGDFQIYDSTSGAVAFAISKANNNVGIGTVNPTQKLDVNGIVNATAFYVNGSPFAGGGSQWTTTGSNIYYNSGNVGIGTTSPAQKLHVKVGTNQNLYVRSTGVVDISAADDAQSDVVPLKIQGSTISLMAVGNVGVGTTNPTGRLTVDGGTTLGDGAADGFSNATGRLRFVSSGNIAHNSVAAVDPGFTMGISKSNGESGGSLAAFLGTTKASGNDVSLALAISGTERLRIDRSGKVGIGTASPAAKLHLQGGGASTATGINVDNYSTTNGWVPGMNFRLSNTNSVGSYATTTSGYYLSEIGFYGVDTTAAGFRQAATIDVVQDGAAGSNFVPARFEFWTVRASDGQLANRMVIKNDGSVGIGTTGPAYKLDVAGTINATEIRVNGAVLNPGTGSNWSVNGSHVYRLGGNVGIGASSPGGKLHIESDSSGGALIVKQGLAGDLAQFWTDTAGNGTQAVTIKRAGNVGIGLTAPAATRLELYDSGTSGSNPTFQSYDYTAGHPSGKISHLLKTRGGSDDVFALQVQGNDGANVGLAVTGTGMVGIGTTTPGSRLAIVNPNTASDLFGLKITQNDPQNWSIQTEGAYGVDIQGTSAYALRTVGSGKVTFEGNVGIGSTSPQAKLDISGSNIGIRLTEVGGYDHLIVNNGGTLNFQSDDPGPGMTTKMSLLNSGQLGIGTSSPNNLLHVKGANAFVQVESPSGLGGLRLMNTLATGTTVKIYAGDSGAGGQDNLVIADDNNTARMVVNTSNGRVGIGTTSPATHLDVHGSGSGANYIVGVRRTDAISSDQDGGFFRAQGSLDGSTFKQMQMGVSRYTGTSSTLHGYLGTDAPYGMILTANNTNPHLAITAAGNIGIGTVSPTQKLDVNGTINATGFTLNGSPFTGSSQWTTAASDIYYNGGNVGIGTTSPNSLAKLHVVGSGSDGQVWSQRTQNGAGGAYLRLVKSRSTQTGAVTSGDTIGHLTYDFYNSAGTFTGGASITSVVDDATAGTEDTHLEFHAAGNGTVAERLRISGTGKVGIGTSAPDSKVHVTGGAVHIGTQGWPSVVSEVDGRLLLAAGSADAAVIMHNDNPQSAGNGPGGVLFTGRKNDSGPVHSTFGLISGYKENATQGDGSGYLAFKTGDAAGTAQEKMRITSAGSVGIGTTVPGRKLDVNGDAIIGTNLLVGTGMYSTTYYPYSGNTLYFRNGTGGDMMTIANGSVGIGTATPNSKLDVVGSGVQMRLTDTANQNPIFNFYEGTTRTATLETYLGNLIIGTRMDSDTILRANSVERFRVTSAGNVGIGTTTPNTRLHVVGGGIRLEQADFADVIWRGSGQSADNKLWSFQQNGLQFHGRVVDDAEGSAARWVSVTRNGAAITSTVFPNGNVGIGTLSPASKLDIVGDAKVTGYGNIQLNPALSAVALIIGAADVGKGGIQFQGLASNTVPSGSTRTISNYGGATLLELGDSNDDTSLSGGRLYVESDNGNVGVGMLDPSYPIHVRRNAAGPQVVAQFENADGANSVNVESIVEITNGSWNGGLQLYFNRDTAAAYLQNTQGGDVRILSSGTHRSGEIARFVAGGNVGIGTTSPGGRLHVVDSGQNTLRVTDSSNYTIDIGYAGANTGMITTLGGTADLALGTNSTARLFIDQSGSIGMGTTAPSSLLHVKGANDPTLTLSNTNVPDVSYNWLGKIDFRRTDGANNALRGYMGYNEYDGALIIADKGASDGWPGIQFHTRNGVKMVIRPNGDVGIGTTNPGTSFQIGNNGDNRYGLATGWNTFSSRRWKTDITPIENPLEKVERLRGVMYSWKSTGKRDIGFIAEEMGEVVPELVTFEDNGKDAKSIDYARVTALLLEAVKAQQTQIRDLQARVDALGSAPTSGK